MLKTYVVVFSSDTLKFSLNVMEVFSKSAWKSLFLAVSLRSQWCDKISAPSGGYFTSATMKSQE